MTPNRVGSLTWHGSQVGPAISWSFPRFLLHHFSLHIPWARKIMGQSFCKWVGSPIPPLEVFSSYKRWPFQVTYPLLLVVLARVTLINFWVGVSIELGFYFVPEMLPPVLSPIILPRLEPFCSLHLLTPTVFTPSIYPKYLFCFLLWMSLVQLWDTKWIAGSTA